jgi:hypothetical protein
MGRILVVVGVIVTLLGCAAVIEPAFRSEGSLLRLLPALVFNLRRPLVGGGDFPAYLSTLGVIVVYFVPAAILLGIGALLVRRAQRAT